LLCERLTVIKVPSFLLEATRAMIAATRNEEGQAESFPVGCIGTNNLAIIH